ncbi:MAG: GTP cyclohydrolase I FolE2 [Theionarchaea archaeon]|nr:GTP cyclohydrolase I FolE2 [Theionarchaea archaeon]MBU7036721.1 GTP cyclohydrolase I FolE2 [Theionarchaea archaeon]
MKDTQDLLPEHPITLEKVGIVNLKTLIRIDRHGREFRHIPTITIHVDLDEQRKGIHMSRLIESVTELLEEEVAEKHRSLEEIGKDILEKLKLKHKFQKSGITIDSELPIYQKTPASKKDTIEIHGITVEVLHDGDAWSKILTVSVTGNTACPHALSMNSGKTHIQRARGILRVETDFGSEIPLEDMVEVVEKSFSSRVYTLLKSDDESFVVSRMYENPLFVEDVCRNMLALSRDRFLGCTIHATCISHESIHRHDVYAEGRVVT